MKKKHSNVSVLLACLKNKQIMAVGSLGFSPPLNEKAWIIEKSNCQSGILWFLLNNLE